MGRLTSRGGRRVATSMAVFLVALGAPGVVLAALLWSLTVSPLTVAVGNPTTFTLTATNQDLTADLLSSQEIGCVIIDVPVTFSVSGAAVTGASTGSSWVASRVDNRVTVHTTSGGDRLETLDWVRYTISATATSTGSLAWDASAHRQQDCSGPGSLLGLPPTVLVVSSPATPTPTPTPTPTLPLPTPTLPLPTLTLPSDTPTPTPTGSPRPTPISSSDPSTQASSDEATPSPPGATGSPSGGPPSTPDPAALPGGITPASGPLAMRFVDPRLGLGVGAIGVLAGVEVWVVPAAAIGGPGLLVLLWVALQAAGAAAWLPAARRLKDANGPRAGRRR